MGGRGYHPARRSTLADRASSLYLTDASAAGFDVNHALMIGSRNPNPQVTPTARAGVLPRRGTLREALPTFRRTPTAFLDLGDDDGVTLRQHEYTATREDLLALLESDQGSDDLRGHFSKRLQSVALTEALTMVRYMRAENAEELRQNPLELARAERVSQLDAICRSILEKDLQARIDTAAEAILAVTDHSE